MGPVRAPSDNAAFDSLQNVDSGGRAARPLALANALACGVK
jgi:hypothetical protein